MKYSVWTLRPKDQQEKQEFKSFRINDVIEQYGYFFVIQAFFTLLPLLSLLEERTTQDIIFALDGIMALLITAVLYYNRQRLGSRFGIGIIVCYVISTLQRITSTKLQIDSEVEIIEQMTILNRNIEITREKAILFAIFFCPSLIYFVIIILCFASGIVALTLFTPDSEEKARQEFLLEIPAYIVLCLVIFYIL